MPILIECFFRFRFFFWDIFNIYFIIYNHFFVKILTNQK